MSVILQNSTDEYQHQQPNIPKALLSADSNGLAHTQATLQEEASTSSHGFSHPRTYLKTGMEMGSPSLILFPARFFLQKYIWGKGQG
jgi:hypothetical protein